jgi:hypothetical protein
VVRRKDRTLDRVTCDIVSNGRTANGTVRVHYSNVSTAGWHTEYCTCTLQWCVYCWVAHRLMYVYTTVMCLLMSGTQSTVRVNFSDVSTPEWHTEYCTCTLQWCVYCWVAHTVLYEYTTVMCVLLSGTQSTVLVHYSDVCTAEWHTVYCTCTLQWCVYCWVAHRVLYVYTTVMCLLLRGTQCGVRIHYSDVFTAEWHTEYCTCKQQWCVYCWVAHRVLYVYTTVICLLLSGTQSTVRVQYSDVSTAEWHTEYCTCTLQWCVYCCVAHRVEYVYTTVMCLLLSGTQSTVRVHCSDVFTAEWHTDYCTCTLQW